MAWRQPNRSTGRAGRGIRPLAAHAVFDALCGRGSLQLGCEIANLLSPS